MNTYYDGYLEARRAFREHGIEAYDLEARLLAEKASGKTREMFIRDGRLYPPDSRYERELLRMLARRLAGEPAAYIIGQWEFRSLPILVTKDTLIPRPATETLAECAIELLAQCTREAPRVLDLCCGTGCVGLSIAISSPAARVVLADLSEPALSVARKNTLRLSLTRRVMSAQADALAPPPPLFGSFDLIVCNPPYIPSADIFFLDTSVRDYEPREALDGGADGLAFYRNIAASWRSLLRFPGRLLFEVGAGQAVAVCNILVENQFTEPKIISDLSGVPRVISAAPAHA